MFIDVREQVDVPTAVAVDRILRVLHQGGLDAISSSSWDEGTSLLVTAESGMLSKTVRVDVLPPTIREGVVVIAFAWTATGALGAAFPVLDANLEITSEPGATTGLRLVGSYRPPGGRVGAAVDRILLHQVADATVRHFLGEIAEAAQQPQVSTLHPARAPEPQWVREDDGH